jgi:serine/threonine protein phosphatase 1
VKFLRRLFPLSPPTTAPCARVPEGQRIYAIGDVHGRADLLRRLSHAIRADLAQFPIENALTVFLGDYVDRGLDSRGVLDHLSSGVFPTPVVYLCGNHEVMLLAFLTDPTSAATWRQFGGVETLHSYGLDVKDFRAGRGFEETASLFRSQLPDEHLSFLKSTKLTCSIGDYFFCHAGVRPGVPLADQKEEDLLWIRNDFLFSESDFGKVIVHGHTPVMEPEVHSNRINIDTGAYISGRLTALVLQGSERRFLSTGPASADARNAASQEARESIY